MPILQHVERKECLFPDENSAANVQTRWLFKVEQQGRALKLQTVTSICHKIDNEQFTLNKCIVLVAFCKKAMNNASSVKHVNMN